MENLTREEAIRRHRLMWNWIADETERTGKAVDKFDAFQHFGWDLRGVINTCWACTYANMGSSNSVCRSKCPLNWPGGECAGGYEVATDSDDMLFSRWSDALLDDRLKEAAGYARLIANIPEKEIS